MEVMFEQYRKEYSDVYSSAKIIEFAREEILADIAGKMNPLSEIPEVREAVGRFYDEIYGKGAGEEFQRGIEGSRYSVRKAAEEPAAFSMGKERDDAAEIMDYFEGTKAEQGREMSLDEMMEEAARSEEGMSAEETDAAAREIMEEMGGGNKFDSNSADAIMREQEMTKENFKLLNELSNSNLKHNVDDVIAITKTNSGKLIWLENGNELAGLVHIVKEHGIDFINKGISQYEISHYLIEAINKGKVIGYQGRGTGRPIYEFEYNGTIQFVAITIGDNGFIVGANPVSMKENR